MEESKTQNSNQIVFPAMGQAYSARSYRDLDSCSRQPMFERHTFQEFRAKQGKLNQDDIKKMVAIREDAINSRHRSAKKKIDQMFDQK